MVVDELLHRIRDIDPSPLLELSFRAVVGEGIVALPALHHG
jgi:hypothetical protein